MCDPVGFSCNCSRNLSYSENESDLPNTPLLVPVASKSLEPLPFSFATRCSSDDLEVMPVDAESWLTLLTERACSEATVAVESHSDVCVCPLTFARRVDGGILIPKVAASCASRASTAFSVLPSSKSSTSLKYSSSQNSRANAFGALGVLFVSE
jgi:hypothetical protein